MEDWLLGQAPPAPGNVRAVIEEKKQEEGHETWTVRLEFGPGHAAHLHCSLWIPPHPQMKRLPVFLSDSDARFARAAFDQGRFLICNYSAGDPGDRLPDESEAYQDLFGKYDWSEFRRRGWSASRVVDWLRTLDFVAPDQIYTGGHSRSGKQALAAAAFDERIAGAIISSPGLGRLFGVTLLRPVLLRRIGGAIDHDLSALGIAQGAVLRGPGEQTAGRHALHLRAHCAAPAADGLGHQ